MKKTVRLTESDLMRIVKRIISEEGMGATSPQATLPNCRSLMNKNKEIGGSSILNGPIDRIEGNWSKTPNYQGYTVYQRGKAFCFIKG